MPVILPWLQLAGCAAIILVCGVRLSRYGDAIAEKTGVSRSWVGVILLATITSLPELVTGVSAVSLAGEPDIAVGNVLGACVINLLILMLIDFLHRHEPVYQHASQGHILSAGFGVILAGFVGFTLVAGGLGHSPRVGHVGLSSLILVGLYLVAIRAVFRYESSRPVIPSETGPRYAHLTLGQVVVRYAAWALGIVAVGLVLPFIGEQVALVMGWETTFVGTLFIALATTTPEAVVTLSAVRIGALDLAIGNLFGSNLFNMLILAVDDVVFVRGPLLEHVQPVHALSAFSTVAMSGIAIVGLLYRPRTRVLRTVGWASLALFSIYLLNAYVLFLHRA